MPTKHRTTLRSLSIHPPLQVQEDERRRQNNHIGVPNSTNEVTVNNTDCQEQNGNAPEWPRKSGKRTKEHKEAGAMPARGRAGANRTTNIGGHEGKSVARVVDFQREDSKHGSVDRLEQFHGKPDQVPAATPPSTRRPPATSRTRRISWNAPRGRPNRLKTHVEGGNDMELLVRNSIHSDGIGFVLGTAKPHSPGDPQAWMPAAHILRQPVSHVRRSTRRMPSMPGKDRTRNILVSTPTGQTQAVVFTFKPRTSVNQPEDGCQACLDGNGHETSWYPQAPVIHRP